MKKIFKVIIAVALIITAGYIFFTNEAVKSTVNLMFFSFAIAYTIKPMQLVLVRKKVNRKLSAIIVLGTLFIIFAAVSFFVIPNLIKELFNINNENNDLFRNLAFYNKKIYELCKNSAVSQVLPTLYNRFENEIQKLLNYFVDYSISIGQNFLKASVVPVVVYYFLAESDRLFNLILVIFPAKYRKMVKQVIIDIDKNLSRYIISQLILSLIITVCTILVLVPLKVDYPIFLSIMNGILNVIPYFGPILGMIPPAIIAFLQSEQKGVYTLVWLYLIQLIEGNIISPKITGDSVDIHPLLVIVLLLIGEEISGFIGMIIAVPIAVVIKVVYEDLDYYLY